MCFSASSQVQRDDVNLDWSLMDLGSCLSFFWTCADLHFFFITSKKKKTTLELLPWKWKQEDNFCIHKALFKCVSLFICSSAVSWKVKIFANVPSSADTVQTADCQFVCVVRCDEYDWAQTRSPADENDLTAIRVLNWRRLENFSHYWKVCEPFVEASSDKTWKGSSRLQLVTEVSKTSLLSVTTALSPPSPISFAVSHPSHLPNWDKHFPNEGVGWESCGE